MSEFPALSAEQCADLLCGLCEVQILCHRRPDGDTLASAVALGIILEQMGKRVHFACDDPVPERLAFVMGDRVLEAPIPETDKVSIDVASPDQLGSLREVAKDVKLMIDHHAKGDCFAPNYIIPETSSAAEVLFGVFEVLEARGKVKMTKELAEAFYTAISSDTGCFRYSNAGADVHRLAARLISVGIDFAHLNPMLFDSKSAAQIKAEGFVSSTLCTAMDGKVGYACITRGDMDERGLKMESFDTAIDVVRSLFGVRIAFVVKECAQGCYRISLRSTGPAVNGIAQAFGGGGHQRAAGCNVDAASASEAVDIILSAIEKNIVL